MSVRGASTSSKTRCSGSANDVAVYCIRAVGGRPRSPTSATRAGAPRDARRTTTRHRRRAASEEAARASGRGDQQRRTGCSRRSPARRSGRPRRPPTRCAARPGRARRSGRARASTVSGASASTAQASAGQRHGGEHAGGRFARRRGAGAARPGEEPDAEGLDERGDRESGGQRDHRTASGSTTAVDVAAGRAARGPAPAAAATRETNPLPGGSAAARQRTEREQRVVAGIRAAARREHPGRGCRSRAAPTRRPGTAAS